MTTAQLADVVTDTATQLSDTHIDAVANLLRNLGWYREDVHGLVQDVLAASAAVAADLVPDPN